MKTMTHKKLAIPALMIAASLLMLFSSNAQSQTYKADFSTKLVLPSGGTDPTHLFTITSGTISGPLSWTLPTTAGANGYVLTTDGTGVLSWVNPATGITLGGDVKGATGNNTINNTLQAGNDIVAALNLATSSINNTGIGVTAGAITGTSLSTSGGGTISTTGAVDGGTGTFTGALSAVGLTSTGGLTSSGGTTNIATTDVNGVNIGTGHFANPIDIGNGDGVTLPYSTTTMAGKVNFTGTVSLPSGSVSAGSIGLTTNDLMVGVGGYGSALPTAISGVLVTNGSGVPSISSTLPNGLTMNNATIGGTSSINTSGAITTTNTLGAGAATVTSLNAGSGAITTTGTVSGGTGTFTNLSGTTMTGALAMGSNNITGAGTITGTTITGTSVSAGSGTISTTGAVDGGTGVFTSTLSAVGLTSTGGLTVSGGTTNIATTDASTVNIGSGAANANAINIGNSGSTTTFLGTVNMPSGSVSASSIGLTTNDLMVGVAGHGSALATANNGVLVTDGSGVPSINATLPSAVQGNITSVGTITSGVWNGTAIANANLANSTIAIGSTGSTLSVTGSPISLGGAAGNVELNLAHANTWTGAQTFGATALTSATTSISAQTNNWALNTSNSYFLVSATSGETVTGILARPGGSIIVLVNTGSNPITLSNGNVSSTAANQFHFQGAEDVIMAQDGTVTLIYDATYNSNVGAWRMISGQ